MTDRPCAAVILAGGAAAAPDDTGPRTARWSHVIIAAIADAGWQPVPLEVGPEVTTTIPHAVLDRLVLCDAVIADVTHPDVALAFTIGVHHGARPGWQVLLGARPDRPDAGAVPRPAPDALTPMLRYDPGPDGAPADPADLRGGIAEALTRLRADVRPLPLHHLVDGPVDELLAHEVTDVFRERARYPDAWRERLAAARSDGVAAVRAAAADLEGSAAGVGEVIDLLLSFRAVGAADEVVRLVEDLRPPLATAALVREQYALALNRVGRRSQARAVLEDLIADRGVSSERGALLGRVHKDAWVDAVSRGDEAEADRCLGRAIDAYVAGFDHDWRDPYPGINAIVLMELREPPDPRGGELLPLVRHAARRRMRSRSPDYWDHATLLELAVLEGDESAAGQALEAALAAVREEWEPRTTGATLARLREARVRRGVDTSWLRRIEEALAQAPVVRR